MNLKELNFGIELETVQRTRETVAKAIQTVVGGEVRHVGSPGSFDPWEVKDTQGRIWKVVADGSLTNVSFNLRAEVVSPVLAYSDIPVLQEVVRAVRRCGARCDEKCSIHVHIDASAFDGRTLGNLAKIVYKQEALIHAALGVQQSRLSRYAKPVSKDLIEKIERNRPKTKEQLNRLWYGYHNQQPQHFDNTRYNSLNFNSVYYRNTIEVRIFEGTLHAGKVRAYVTFCLALAAKALNGRAASSRKREFDPQSARYDFRIFLIHLGIIGYEFKAVRKHLLAAMPGDSAFKRGRPVKEPQADNAAEPLAAAPAPEEGCAPCES